MLLSLRSIAVALSLVASFLPFGDLLQQSTETQALSIFYKQNYLSNNLLGVGVPPYPRNIKGWRATPDYLTEVQLIIEELVVDDVQNSFDARFIWHLKYNDSRFYNLYWEDSTPYQNCTILCSTNQNAVTNKWGETACCNAEYVPNSHFLNLKGSRVNSTAQEWYWYGSPTSDEVNYWFRGRVTLNANFDFSGYPFEHQRLQFIIYGDYIPQLPENSFILDSTPDGVPFTGLTSKWKNSDARDFSIVGWSILDISSSTVAYYFNGSGDDLADSIAGAPREVLAAPGVTFTIIVARQTTGFYIQLFVIPPALEVLMMFGSYGLSVDTLRNRLEFVGILFLSLLFVQYSVRVFLPAAVLLPPYVVCMVSYGYVFGFAVCFLLVETLSHAHSIAARKKRLLAGRLSFARYQCRHLKLIATQEALKHGPGGEVKPENHLLIKARATVEVVEGSLKALEGPWYLRHESRAALFLLRRLSVIRALDKWYFCLTKSTSKDYCAFLARKLERVLALLLFVTFYIALALIFALQRKLSLRIGPV